MTRRQWLSLGGWWAARAGLPAPDIALAIAETNLELAPRKVVKTLAYNGQAPGPLLRAKEGQTITVEVQNDSTESDMVHWHGFHIPAEVDGAHEEGTPHVPPHESRRYTFTARPAGTRWYHSHGHAGHNLRRNTYSGQFGMFIVTPKDEAGQYDLEVPLILHEWDASFTDEMDVAYKLYSINGKMLGAGEPIRVRRGQRVLFRVLNASATLTHRLALPGHRFQAIAMDGNPVPSPKTVPVLELGPAERVDAVVEMAQAGVWILGETRDGQRAAGMGIVVEYAGESGAPRWVPAVPFVWDYTIFGSGGAPAASAADGRFPLAIKQSGHKFTVNGKSFPYTDPLLVSPNRRYRLIFDNQTADAHPMHLHRHRFEIVRVGEKATAGLWKDTVVVPGWREVEVEVVAANPGPTLMHCHQQLHMDEGFMMMMQYA